MAPPTLHASQAVMVRRIAALGGDEMVSEDETDTAFSVPKDHFWCAGHAAYGLFKRSTCMIDRLVSGGINRGVGV